MVGSGERAHMAGEQACLAGVEVRVGVARADQRHRIFVRRRQRRGDDGLVFVERRRVEDRREQHDAQSEFRRVRERQCRQRFGDDQQSWLLTGFRGVFARGRRPFVDHAFHARDHFGKFHAFGQFEVEPVDEPAVGRERLRGPVQQRPVDGVSDARHDQHVFAGFGLLHAVLAPWGHRGRHVRLADGVACFAHHVLSFGRSASCGRIGLVPPVGVMMVVCVRFA